MIKRIICIIMTICIMLTVQSCSKNNAIPPDFRIAIVGSNSIQPFYEVANGSKLTAALYDEYKVAFTKGRDLKTWTEDIFIQKKEHKLSRKEKEMISHYIQNIINRQPKNPVVRSKTSMYDIKLNLNDKIYTSIYSLDEGQVFASDEDPDMIRLLQYLMQLVPFKNDEIWGSTYKWILENKQ